MKDEHRDCKRLSHMYFVSAGRLSIVLMLRFIKTSLKYQLVSQWFTIIHRPILCVLG